MAWERRGNKHYYYRKLRVGRRVWSTYVGPGEKGKAAALRDQIVKTGKDLEKASTFTAAKELRRLGRINQQCTEFEEIVWAIVHAGLVTNGYHTHHRQWRKRKCRK